jgi:hypothetical protein
LRHMLGHFAGVISPAHHGTASKQSGYGMCHSLAQSAIVGKIAPGMPQSLQEIAGKRRGAHLHRRMRPIIIGVGGT